MPTPYTEAELAVIEQAAAGDRQAREAAQELVARHFHDRSVDALRIKIGEIRRKQRPLRREALSEGPEGAEHHEQTADSWHIAIPKTRICTLEQLIEHCRVDLDRWAVERFVVNKWEVGAKDAEGTIQVEPLYQVKAWLKRNRSREAMRAEVDAMLAEIRDGAPKFKAIVRPQNVGDVLVELSIPDLHVGKLAWGEECGDDYDSTIAGDLFRQAVEDLLARAVASYGHRIAEVLLVFGNDMLNVDNDRNETTAGTRQDVDTRSKKVFRTARQLTVWAIERARKVAPVRALFVPGNHDRESVFYLGEVIEAWFNACPDVTVDNSPAMRKYVEFGKVLLLFTHGNEEKHGDLPLIMAQERPEAWARTRYREAHLGHFHKKRVMSRVDIDEFAGVRVRILPSLCQSEAWHTSRGYVGNQRSAEAYAWCRATGLSSYLVWSVPEPVSAA